MVSAPVRRDNPRILAMRLSTVQAHKPCSTSLVHYRGNLLVAFGLLGILVKNKALNIKHYGVSRAKDGVSVDCSTRLNYRHKTGKK